MLDRQPRPHADLSKSLPAFYAHGTSRRGTGEKAQGSFHSRVSDFLGEFWSQQVFPTRILQLQVQMPSCTVQGCCTVQDVCIYNHVPMAMPLNEVVDGNQD